LILGTASRAPTKKLQKITDFPGLGMLNKRRIERSRQPERKKARVAGGSCRFSPGLNGCIS